MGFYDHHPTPITAWRLAVLMGANSRTYKFALAEALLLHARADRTDVSLGELAVPYAFALAKRAVETPQAPSSSEIGPNDFLSIAVQDARKSISDGAPTERLVEAAIRTMPGMVMQKFHNLAGGAQVSTQFYALRGRGAQRRVELAPELQAIAQSEDGAALAGELSARWAIVESSFAVGIGRSLITDGVAVDLPSGTVTDKARRRSVTGIREALGGFQYNRCHICGDTLTPRDPVAIDHVFPHSLMRRGVILGWTDLDLDTVWNLALAHAGCNGHKSNRPPAAVEVTRLARRNAAIMRSPHPLKRTLELTLRARGYPGHPGDWIPFLSRILAA